MLSYGDCVNYLKYAYNTINGEINPLAPAISLALTECRDIRDADIMATQSILSVEIRLSNMLQQLGPLGLTDSQLKGALLYVLAHELSHCDQKKDVTKIMYKDQKYIDLMEYTNEINTFRYLRDNECYLQSVLGPYEIPPIVRTQYSMLQANFNNQIFHFPQIESIKEIVLFGLSVLMNHYVYIDNNIRNINLYLYVGKERKLYDSFRIVKNLNFVCGKRDMFKLSQLIARGIFDYKRKISYRNNDCELTLYLDYPPVHNVVIIG